MSKKLVIIDAGHGGYDSGAVGKVAREKNIVLTTAIKLQTALIKAGFDARLVRWTDDFVELADRAKMANAAGAILYISLHCNSSISALAGGTEVWIQNAYTAEEITLAQLVVNGMATSFGLTNRGVKKSDFAVLRLTTMSAFLIEWAFISNAKEEAIMNDPANQDKLVAMLTTILCNYYGVVPMDDITRSVNIFVEKGIINSPDEWVKVFKGEKLANAEYSKILLQRIVDNLK